MARPPLDANRPEGDALVQHGVYLDGDRCSLTLQPGGRLVEEDFLECGLLQRERIPPADRVRGSAGRAPESQQSPGAGAAPSNPHP